MEVAALGGDICAALAQKLAPEVIHMVADYVGDPDRPHVSTLEDLRKLPTVVHLLINVLVSPCSLNLVIWAPARSTTN